MQLTGIYAPIVTPFDADENINYNVLEQLIDFLLANGLSGLVPGGTTSKVYALSDSERLELLQFVHRHAGAKTTLIAGVNAGATRDVIRYAQAAEKMGYHALMVAVPPYSRPSQRELLAHYRAVAANTGPAHPPLQLPLAGWDGSRLRSARRLARPAAYHRHQRSLQRHKPRLRIPPALRQPLPDDLRLRRPGPRLLPVRQHSLDWRRILRPAPTCRRAAGRPQKRLRGRSMTPSAQNLTECSWNPKHPEFRLPEIGRFQTPSFIY